MNATQFQRWCSMEPENKIKNWKVKCGYVANTTRQQHANVAWHEKSSARSKSDALQRRKGDKVRKGDVQSEKGGVTPL